jgi:hypothetical protein
MANIIITLLNSTFVIVLLLGMVSGAAGYIFKNGMHEGQFSFYRFFSYAFVGGFVAITSGFLTTHYGIEGNLQYFLVCACTFYSRELLDLGPRLLKNWVINNIKSILRSINQAITDMFMLDQLTINPDLVPGFARGGRARKPALRI